MFENETIPFTGKGPYLYRHELIGLHNRHLHKFSLPMNKIPEKFLPRKYAITTKVSGKETECVTYNNPSLCVNDFHVQFHVYTMKIYLIE